MGYKGGPGFYTISGGSIVADANYSQLLVGPSGSVNGGTGTFTVQGTGGSISVSKLYVGVQDSAGSYTGTGTLAFEIDGGVSAINAESVYIDPYKFSCRGCKSERYQNRRTSDWRYHPDQHHRTQLSDRRV